MARGRRAVDSCAGAVHLTATGEPALDLLHLPRPLDALLPQPVGVSAVSAAQSASESHSSIPTSPLSESRAC